MIRFAKILETKGHQFLIRSCHHPALAGLPPRNEAPSSALLTIDTEFATADADNPDMARMVINCQQPPYQQLLFELFNAAQCQQVLHLLELQRRELLSPQEMIEATGELQDLLLAQVK